MGYALSEGVSIVSKINKRGICNRRGGGGVGWLKRWAHFSPGFQVSLKMGFPPRKSKKKQEKKMKMQICGPNFNSEGYAISARDIVEWLI